MWVGTVVGRGRRAGWREHTILGSFFTSQGSSFDAVKKRIAKTGRNHEVYNMGVG